jgi:hypothetical protein
LWQLLPPWSLDADSLAKLICLSIFFLFSICSRWNAPDYENPHWLFEKSARPPKARAGVQWAPSWFFDVLFLKFALMMMCG